MSEKLLILASSSQTRRDMLMRAGLDFGVMRPQADEDALKAALVAEGAPAHDIAAILSEAKARSIAVQHPGRLVLGSDQILVQDAEIFSKVSSRDAAAEQLSRLSGRSHQLISAAVLMQGPERLWHHHESVRMTMKTLTAAEIDDYLDRIGDAAFWSVGCYQLEGIGVQLFDRVDGDYFSVLGLPLLALLRQLRLMGIMGDIQRCD